MMMMKVMKEVEVKEGHAEDVLVTCENILTDKKQKKSINSEHDAVI